MNTALPERAKFHHMKDGTAEDWQVIMKEFQTAAAELPDRMLEHLRVLDGDCGGFPVDRLTHCLQTATLAHKDGKDEEYVVCALLHDIGDTLGPYNHADIAATYLEPFVSEQNYWMVKHHAIFQGYYFFHHIGLDRDQHKQFESHPHYAYTKEFIEKYDAPAFDPDAETYSLEFFEPMVRRVFAAPKASLYKAALEE
ncbi:phosphohydrolase [Congregibacter variabilis]|uniref:Phosphohydrolase n=1 Tax=Congregibacter variabilis TaxID=3081200 RepID=A0ABZ0I1P6_9GAMM|nr:phosphohydrolase [Congregibacter sp. IMCC43200]